MRVTDKRPVYPGAIPLDLDTLLPQRNMEIAIGFLMQAAFGTGTVYDGLAVTQTSPTTMAVKVGPGSIITATTVDTLTTGFGSLAVDNSDPLVKMGINLGSTTMGLLTAPATAGFSVNVLVEAQFLEADGGAVVLPFYNAANPAIPYTGPSNTGTASNTARTQSVQLQYKYGTAAATGSQVTPAPDAGWLGVAVVTVANGQASITNSNITPYVGAAGVTSIATKLPAIRQKLTANLNLYVSPTGSDSNSGLSASVPFATLQKAWNVLVNNYDLAGYSVTVNLANGTYTGGVTCQGAPQGFGSGNTIMFLGNTAAPGNVTVSVSGANCFQAFSGATVTLSGMTLVASGSSPTGYALVAGNGGFLSLGAGVVFGAASTGHIYALNGGAIAAQVPYSITGSSPAHWLVQAGTIAATGAVITLTGTPAFSTGFVFASILGNVQCGSCTFTGSATGTRYYVTSNAVVNTGGQASTYLPGNATYATVSGGQYT